MTEPDPRAIDAPPTRRRAPPHNYPEPFAALMDGREKRALGDSSGSPTSASI